jgi:hypothetical protein
MDVFKYSLESTFHLRLVPTPADGNCLFHAVVMALKRSPMGAQVHQATTHATVRELVCNFLVEHMKYFSAFNIDLNYTTRMRASGSWGGEPELIALTNLYARSIEVYMFDPHGRATHSRTYSPVLGLESAAPLRVSLLPVSGNLGDAPNHFSYLEQIPTVLGAVHRPIAPAPVASEVDLTCDEPMPPEHEEVEHDDLDNYPADMFNGPRPPFLESAAPVAAPLAASTTTKVSYYPLYEHYLHTKGMHRLEADLAARAEVAWYSCTCGKACRKAAHGSDVYERVVLNPEEVNPDCKVWKPWSMYHTVVRARLGRA